MHVHIQRPQRRLLWKELCDGKTVHGESSPVSKGQAGVRVGGCGEGTGSEEGGSDGKATSKAVAAVREGRVRVYVDL